jgi:hypothetical protein
VKEYLIPALEKSFSEIILSRKRKVGSLRIVVPIHRVAANLIDGVANRSTLEGDSMNSPKGGGKSGY